MVYLVLCCIEHKSRFSIIYRPHPLPMIPMTRKFAIDDNNIKNGCTRNLLAKPLTIMMDSANVLIIHENRIIVDH